jgi:predicted amidohydrolase YtcJ
MANGWCVIAHATTDKARAEVVEDIERARKLNDSRWLMFALLALQPCPSAS